MRLVLSFQNDKITVYSIAPVIFYHRLSSLANCFKFISEMNNARRFLVTWNGSDYKISGNISVFLARATAVLNVKRAGNGREIILCKKRLGQQNRDVPRSVLINEQTESILEYFNIWAIFPCNAWVSCSKMNSECLVFHTAGKHCVIVNDLRIFK